MARILKGLRIRRLRDVDPERTGYTRFKVRGEGRSVYVVTVDSQGLWSCTCKSAKFRGVCYHMMMVKFTAERDILVNRIIPMSPARVSRRDFEYYFSLPRFIAEPIYAGPRQFVVFGKQVWLGKRRRDDWELPEFARNAGTILEGTWNTYGQRTKVFRVFDCLYHRGIDFTHSPLAMRRERLEAVLQAWHPGGVEPSECAIDAEEKKELMAKWGCCILKDINSPYITEGITPRCWMVKEVKRRGRPEKEDDG